MAKVLGVEGMPFGKSANGGNGFRADLPAGGCELFPYERLPM